MPKSSLGHIPGAERWAFDASVTDVFDDMLVRSIPQYGEMRRLVTSIGRRYVRQHLDVLDLGCSRGDALAPFVDTFGGYARAFVGVEVSDPMLAAAKERFRGRDDVRIMPCDLRRDFPVCVPALVLGVLTLQFVPIEHRQRLVRNVFEALYPGGAFIVVEKVLGARAESDELLVSEYLALKEQNGYSPEEIARKRLALEGVLVPVTSEWNEAMLRGAGFGVVECFWRWCNFAAWLAVKPTTGTYGS